MRTEQEMMELILSTAREDDRVRAVFLGGSRANPNAPRDCFQDYDVVYLVDETASFRENHQWFRRFGEELIFQFRDDSVLFPSSGDRTGYGCLMQFADGNRIDLTVRPFSELSRFLEEDKLELLLLDKTGIVGNLPSPTDEDYRVQKPSAAQYMDCCNEFYWVSNYAAKGLWRQELPYAHEMLDHYIRDMLMQMLSWYVGVQTDFSVSVGKCGKYLKNRLSAQEYSRLKKTYASGEYEDIWNALEEMQSLFRDCALAVGQSLGYSFPEHWHENVTAFCREIRALPEDAASIR